MLRPSANRAASVICLILASVAALALTSSALAAALFGAGDPTAAQVAQAILSAGAKVTVDTLYQSGKWDGVVDRISKGGSDWIAVAPKLARGVDAGPAEDLGIALATALPRNAKGVLGVIDPNNGPVIGVGQVCSMPFIEETPRHLATYRRKSLAALAAVRDPALSAMKSACLAALKAAP